MDSLENLPLCTAPFHSVLIDTNKGVRPCCAWQGKYLGNLEEESIQDIMEGAEWNLIKSKLTKGEWPKGCLGCKHRELESGWSVRKVYLEDAKRFPGKWKLGLEEIEFNSTNYCNLACMHCSADFSSKWIPLEQKLQANDFNKLRSRGCKLHPADPALILEQISKIDLQQLRTLRIKGGEPMINPEVPVLLKHLNELRILPQIDLQIVTNASVIPKGLFELISKAKSVTFNLSVDGVEKVQAYIRYGESDLEKIEQFIDHFSHLHTVFFQPTVSVMAYNIFSLDKVADWWKTVHQKHGKKTTDLVDFTLHVMEPKYLSVSVLSDKSRNALLQKYTGLIGANYEHVLKLLQVPFSGPDLHNDFVRFTHLLDKFRGISILDYIPEISDELVIHQEKANVQNDASIIELNGLIAKGAKDALLFFKRGLIKRENGDMAGAFADLKEAVQADSDLFPLIPEHWWD